VIVQERDLSADIQAVIPPELVVSRYVDAERTTNASFPFVRSWLLIVAYLTLPWVFFIATPSFSFHETPSCGFCETFAETELWLLYPKDFSGTYFEQRIGPESQIQLDEENRKNAIEANPERGDYASIGA
jgi:hypothetical protein